MQKENQDFNPQDEKDKTFVQVPRWILYDLINDKINVKEYLLLSILWLASNPVNGKWFGSYSTLYDLINSLFSLNYVNKAMLGLKRKKYLWFNKHQGRRKIEVRLNHYPLTNKSITDLYNEQKQKPVIVEEASEQKSDRTDTDLSDIWQTFQQIKKDKIGRSPNNDNENNNNNENNKSLSLDKSLKEKIDPETFPIKSYEDERCKEYALNLGEKDMRFILSMRSKYGFDVVERAYEMTMETPNVDKKGAYFNKLVREIGEGNLEL